MRCPICEKGNLVKVDDIVSEIDGYVFISKGIRCLDCGEEIIDELEGRKIIRVAKRLSVWGPPLKLKRKLSFSGRGTVLRIPSDISDDLKLKGDEEVLVSRHGRKIIIELE